MTASIPKLPKTLPASIQHFIERCTAKEPIKRYRSMVEVGKVLFEEAKKVGLMLPSQDLLFTSRDTFSTVENLKWSKRSRLVLRLISPLTIWWNRKSLVFRRFPIALLIWILATYLFIPTPIQGTGQLERWTDLRILNIYFRFRGTRSPPEEILLVPIRERGLEVLGEKTTLGLSRKRIIELLELLAKYQPKAIVIDLRFFDSFSTELDRRLVEALKGSPTFIAEFHSALSDSISKTRDESQILTSRGDFLDAASGVFDASLVLTDGVAYLLYFSKRDNRFVQPLSEILQKTGYSVVDSPQPGDLINYYGPPGTLPTITMDDVLTDNVSNPTETFRDKIIVVGLQLELSRGGNSLQQPDIFTIPLQKLMYGMEIHGTILGNLIQKNWIRRIPLGLHFLFFGFMSLFLSLLILTTPSFRARVIAGGVTASLFLLAFASLHYWNLFIPISGLVFVIVASALAPQAPNFLERVGRIFVDDK